MQIYIAIFFVSASSLFGLELTDEPFFIRK